MVLGMLSTLYYGGMLSYLSFNTVTSIVIVHGLGGDAYTTWTADNRIMWPRDFIPQVIPTARVMTFGYNSKWAFSPSTADIKDFALDLLNRLRNKRWSADVCLLNP